MAGRSRAKASALQILKSSALKASERKLEKAKKAGNAEDEEK